MKSSNTVTENTAGIALKHLDASGCCSSHSCNVVGTAVSVGLQRCKLPETAVSITLQRCKPTETAVSASSQRCMLPETPVSEAWRHYKAPSITFANHSSK